MTEKEKERRAEAAASRAASVEAREVAEINAVWDRIPFDTKRTLIYITGRIAHESDPSEIKCLRETRAIHFGPVKRRLQKEAPCSQE